MEIFPRMSPLLAEVLAIRMAAGEAWNGTSDV